MKMFGLRKLLWCIGAGLIILVANLLVWFFLCTKVNTYIEYPMWMGIVSITIYLGYPFGNVLAKLFANIGISKVNLFSSGLDSVKHDDKLPPDSGNQVDID